MSVHPPSSILHPRRILVRGVNWLGDAVMTTPALQRLRERFPDARLTLLTPDKLGGLWLHHPGIDELIQVPARETLWSVAGRLRRHDFDVGLALPNSPRSALELWLARIPTRIGYARPWRACFLTSALQLPPNQPQMRKRSVREIKKLIRKSVECRVRSDANTEHATRNTQHAHHLHHYLRLVACLGANPEPLPPHLEVTPSELQSAEAALIPELQPQGRHAASGKPLVFFGLNPGAEYGPAKRWPAQNFAQVLRTISQKLDHSCWLLFGGPQDQTLADEISRSVSGSCVINLAGKTSLRQLMALLKLCRVVLTNDTGPMHLAAALGTPVVVPFGSTSPEFTAPGLPGDPRHHLLTSKAPCSPCFRRTCPIDFRCMTSITVETVAERVIQAARAIPVGI